MYKNMLILHLLPNSLSCRLHYSTSASTADFAPKKSNFDFRKVKTNKFFKKNSFKQKHFTRKRPQLSFRQLLKKFVLKKRQRVFSWNKNKKPYWRQKFFLKKLRYSNFILPFTSHIRGAAPNEIHVEDINERHLWTYNVKYRRVRFVFRNKIYMRKTLLRRYGFKNKNQLKKYQLKIYKTRRPLDAGFSALECRLSHLAVRLGWLRSISVATKVIKLGGLSVNGGVFKNPSVCVKLGDTLLVRKKIFTRVVAYVKKFYRFRKRGAIKFNPFRLDSSVYLKTHRNSIYKYRFLRIGNFRLKALKTLTTKNKKRFRLKKFSKLLKKSIRFYKIFLSAAGVCAFCLRHSGASSFRTSKYFWLYTAMLKVFLFWSFLSLTLFCVFGLSFFNFINSGVYVVESWMPVFFFYRTTEDKNIFEFNKFHVIILLFFDIFHITYTHIFILDLFFNRQCCTFCYAYYSLFKHFFEEFVFPVAETALLLEAQPTNTFTFVVLFVLLEFCGDTFRGHCRCYTEAKYRLCLVSTTQYVFRLKKKQHTLYRRKRNTNVIAALVKNKFLKAKKGRNRFPRSKYRRFGRNRFVPWRVVKVVMNYLGLRKKLIHPLPLSVFFKNTFVLYSVIFSKKLVFNRLGRCLSNLRFSFFQKKHNSLKKLLLFNVLNLLKSRKVLLNLKNKKNRLSNRQFEFSKHKAGFILSSKFRLLSFAWLKSANILQLNRKVFDVFSNQKLY